MVQCFKLQVECNSSKKEKGDGLKSKVHPSLQQVLDNFEDVFNEPNGLPPQRVQDHNIPLKEGT